jgi:putative transposase
MRHINGAYTTYFNIKRKRSGHLFQGRYKAILVEFNEYALELSRYIHLNPVRAGMVARPEEYRWSSYRNYIGQCVAPTWLKMETIHDYFGKKTKEAMKKYRSFVEELLGKEYDSPFRNTFGAAVLGTDEFREMVTSQHLAEKEVDRAVPGIRQFKRSPKPEEILKAVAAVTGGNAKLARQVGMYLCHRYSGKKLREIGNLFGVGETAIAEARRLLSRKLEKDKQLVELVEKVRAVLGI